MGQKARISAQQRLLRDRRIAQNVPNLENSVITSVLVRHLNRKAAKSVTPSPPPVPDPLAQVLPVTIPKRKNADRDNAESSSTSSFGGSSKHSPEKNQKLEQRSTQTSPTSASTFFSSSLPSFDSQGSLRFESDQSLEFEPGVGNHQHFPPDVYLDLLRFATASMKEKMIHENLNYIECKQCPFTVVFHSCHVPDVDTHVGKHMPKRFKSFGCRVCGKVVKGPKAHFMRIHPEIYATERHYVGSNLTLLRKSRKYVADLRGNFQEESIAALKKCFPDHCEPDGEIC